MHIKLFCGKIVLPRHTCFFEYASKYISNLYTQNMWSLIHFTVYSALFSGVSNYFPLEDMTNELHHFWWWAHPPKLSSRMMMIFSRAWPKKEHADFKTPALATVSINPHD